MKSSSISRSRASQDGEFLWLVSLSDLMILLFVFFVVLFSFAYKKLGPEDFKRLASTLRSGKTESTPLDEIQAQLLKWVVDKKLLNDVTIEKKEDALILQIREHALFASGESALISESQPLLEAVGKYLGSIPSPYRIGIEGHTDDNPIINSRMDNWLLSTNRAHSVLKALKLSPDQLKRTVLFGFAEMKPVSPNRDAQGKALAENQARNRRVTVRIF